MSITVRLRVMSLFEADSSALSAAALSLAIRSASMAAASASGISGIVSKEEILGLRERMLDGVDGIDELEGKEYRG